MTRPQDFPIPLQNDMISANLNSSLVLQFFTGMYTAIYAVTMYIYLFRHDASRFNKRIVATTLTLLYSTTLGEVGLGWYFLTTTFSAQGDSKLAIFVASATGASTSPVLNAMAIILGSTGFILADGIMVWRCFQACGQLLMFALPMLFFVAEFILVAVDVIFGSLTFLKPGFETISRDRQIDHIGGAMFVAIAGTSLTATAIICHFIYTSQPHNLRSRRQYRQIADILIQSSAMYTTVVLVTTICTFMVPGDIDTSDLKMIMVQNYFETLLAVMKGLAPTIMVARLAIASEKRDGMVTERSSIIVPSEIEALSFHQDVEESDDCGSV